MLKITCWNCGDTGHFSLKCKKQKKTKESKAGSTSDSKQEGTSAAAAENSSDDEGAWVVEEIGGGGESADWFLEAIDESGCDVEDVDLFEEAVVNDSCCLNFGSSVRSLRFNSRSFVGSVADEHVDDDDDVNDDVPELQEMTDSEDKGDDFEEE